MEASDHILVVDDDAEIRGLLGEYLRKNGYKASVVPDGKATSRTHGGELSLRNRPEGGLEATLTLPRTGGSS